MINDYDDKDDNDNGDKDYIYAPKEIRWKKEGQKKAKTGETPNIGL